MKSTEPTPISRHPYAGRMAVLATKHGKEQQIARPLHAAICLKVCVPPTIDTDRLGTLSGLRVDSASSVRAVAHPVGGSSRSCATSLASGVVPRPISSAKRSLAVHPAPIKSACRELMVFVMPLPAYVHGVILNYFASSVRMC